MSVYTQFYDFIVNHTDELELLGKLAKAESSEAKLWEGGIGTGRIAIPLARKGHLISAVEKNPEMLEIITNKLEMEPPEVQNRIKIEQNDFTKSEILPDSLDLAYFTSNTFLLVANENSQQKLLEKINRGLKKGGKLYFEIFNPAEFFGQIFSQRGLIHLYTRINPKTGLDTAHFVSYLHNPIEQLLIGYNFIEEFPTDSPSQRYKFTEVVRYMNLPELRYRLQNAGFTKIEVFSDHDLNPLEMTSLKIIIIAQK